MTLATLRPLLASLCVVFAACQSSPSAGEPAPASTANAKEAAAESNDAAKKAAAKARKEAKKAHELACARTDLEIAELETQAATRKAQDELDEARRELDEAKRALEHFNTRSLPQELADGRLDLDQSIQRKLEAEQELREMEATYAKDQFAKDTKELVLTRHKKQAEFAARRLELAEQQYADLERERLPRELREHETKLRKAEREVREAEVELAKTELENKVKLAKAKFEIEELSRPDDDDEDDEPKGKSGAKK